MDKPRRQEYKQWLNDSLIKIQDLSKIQDADQLLYIGSLHEQIKYLIDLENNNKPIPEKDLARINIGLIAVREIESFDSKFAHQLMNIDYWSKNLNN